MKCTNADYPLLLSACDRLCTLHRQQKEQFLDAHAPKANEFRTQITAARNTILASEFNVAADLGFLSPFFDMAISYCETLDWSLIDVSFLATSVGYDTNANAITDYAWSTILYHAIRILDDVID